MMKPETVKRYLEKLADAVRDYDGISLDELNVAISGGNMKIGPVMNVSLPAILSCGNCASCMLYCYAVRQDTRFPEALRARARNWSIFQRSRAKFFREVREAMARREAEEMARREAEEMARREAGEDRPDDIPLRWHVAGEIVDMDHFNEMNITAVMFPNWRTWTYTEMHWIVNAYIRAGHDVAGNFSPMFSAFGADALRRLDNPYGMPVFLTIKRGEEIPAEAAGWYRCPGKCQVCLKAKRGCPYRENVVNFEH